MSDIFLWLSHFMLLRSRTTHRSEWNCHLVSIPLKFKKHGLSCKKQFCGDPKIHKNSFEKNYIKEHSPYAKCETAAQKKGHWMTWGGGSQCTIVPNWANLMVQTGQYPEEASRSYTMMSVCKGWGRSLEIFKRKITKLKNFKKKKSGKF